MKKEIITHETIQTRIYTLRNLYVLLDRDLALLYGVKPIRLREQVKRNINRFPPDFYFQLSQDEVSLLVSQNAIPSKMHLGGYLPYAFTEQGVAMLSTVLRSKTAVTVSLQIMRAFVQMRKFLSTNADLFQKVDTLEKRQLDFEHKTEINFKNVFATIEDKTLTKKQGIFYDGQIFDAYQFVSTLIVSAHQSIILIDNYIDDTVLTLFAKRKKQVKVTIYTKKINPILKLDISKFNDQYDPIEIKEFALAHDRFLIIDQHKVFHFGASLRDLGKKWFAFSELNTESLALLNKLDITQKSHDKCKI